MKRQLRCHEAFAFGEHEAKRTRSPPCGEAALHRAKPCFIFHAPQVHFISKNKNTVRWTVFLFLELVAGFEPATC